jgi:hypothetical protein
MVKTQNFTNMNRNHTTRRLVFAFMALLTAGACNKPATINIPQEGTIYMPQAYSTRGSLSLVLTDSTQQVYFGAAYGGLKYPSGNIICTYVIDTTLIAAYNAAHGTSYVALPAKTYAPSALQDTILAGKTSSSAITLSIVTASLDFTGHYMLPVRLTSVSAGKIDTSLSVTYFTIDQLVNMYAGSYSTTGTRYNYNADGSYAGSSSISDTRVLTTMSFDSCSINTIANLGAYNGTVFFVRVNPDNTLEFSGYLQNVVGSPIGNQPGKTSTYDPVTHTFDVHYMYTNTNGTYRYMDEVWTPQ